MRTGPSSSLREKGGGGGKMTRESSGKKRKDDVATERPGDHGRTTKRRDHEVRKKSEF